MSNRLKISPRWPDQSVWISEQVLSHLELLQQQLEPNIRLVVTRGFESHHLMRRIIRYMGSILFRLIYPSRRNECQEIFSPNGHDLDGCHVDISLEVNQQPLKLLPLGVFTPMSAICKIQTKHAIILKNVYNLLSKSGFSIHSNPVESLQIHCHLKA